MMRKCLAGIKQRAERASINWHHLALLVLLHAATYSRSQRSHTRAGLVPGQEGHERLLSSHQLPLLLGYPPGMKYLCMVLSYKSTGKDVEQPIGGDAEKHPIYGRIGW